LLAAALLGAALGICAQAADMYQPGGLTPGGVPAQSQLTALTPTGSNATVCWHGLQGWYGVESSASSAGPWTSVGTTAASDFNWCLTVPSGGSSNAFFRLNQYNGYVGAGGCAGCHGDKFNQWQTTGHADAFSGIANLPPAVRKNCLPCHTVGYGQPTGFVDPTTTPQLMDVGCENCHGPAAGHKYGDHDLIRPAVTIASEVCGGCHSGDHNPTYNEWTNSPHAQFLADVGAGVNDTLSGQSRMVQCGPCHSGAARLAMLGNYANRLAGVTNYLRMPSTHDETNYAVTCAVCHDPHNAAAYATTNIVTTPNGMVTNIVVAPFQLRNPMRSTNFFTFFTATPTVVTARTNFAGVVTRTTNYVNDNFTSQYDPSVQICAQCHNSRGARWDGLGRTWTGSNFVASTTPSWSRPPHHSPQYNMLIGSVQPDYLNGTTNVTHRHSGFTSTSTYNTNQCATCHVPAYSTTNVVSGATNIRYNTGHTFALDTKNCVLSGCHGSVPNWQSQQTSNIRSISNIVQSLNQWATNAGPALFGANYAKYLQNAWEYTTPGALATITNAGPSAADQLKIPEAIKQARFDLYMAQYDGSFGIHNPSYFSRLTSDASTKVGSSIAGATNAAYFVAGATTGYAPFTNTFQSYGSGITSYSWAFGDGGTSTSANPTYVYNGPGTNTVTLTVATAGGTTTYYRTNYIRTYAQPVVAFTAGPLSGEAPLTVTFTNTSTSTNAVTAWRWSFGSVTVTTNAPVYTYTFTNATPTNYNVALRATTPLGTITTTYTNRVPVTP
jgi:hypothetical protein